MQEQEIKGAEIEKITIVYKDTQPDHRQPISEKDKLIYEAYGLLRNGEMDRLFQRVNFILVSMAFLIGAIAALFVSDGLRNNDLLKCLVVIICLTGLLLSIAFTVSNWFNNKNLVKLIDTLHNFEKDKISREPIGHSKYDNENVKCLPKHFVAPITVLIPLGFCFFWLILGWLFILNI